MQYSMIESSIYIISFLIVNVSFYLLKKSDKTLNGAGWIPITLITYMCYTAFVSGIINLGGVPITINTISILNIIMSVLLIYFIVKNKKVQKYHFSKIDLLFFTILGMIVLYIGLKRFGVNLDIHYNTSDPSIHFRYAMDIVNSKNVSDMYFASLNNALLIETLSPLFNPIEFYKIFIISDIMMWYLSAIMFYALLQRFVKDTFTKVIAIVITVIYMFGYPLNNMIYGFVYLGIGVSLIAYLIYMFMAYIHEEFDRNINTIMLSIGCLGLFLCYVLFMPITYLATFISLTIYYFNKKELFKIDTIIRYFIIYFIPCVLGLYYTYFGVFSEGVTPTSAIANEGAIYRDLYSNFIFLIPFMIYGIYELLKRKKNDVTLILLVILVGFMFVLFLGGMKGKVSSYYFYKNYYPLWMICLALTFRGLTYLAKVSKEIIVTTFITLLMIVGLFISNIEVKIQKKNELFSPEVKAGEYMDIYSFNREVMLHDLRYSSKKIELYDEATKLRKFDDVLIPLAGNWDDFYWYEAISNQRMENYYNWVVGDEIYFEKLGNEDLNYITVLKGSELYSKYESYFKGLETIYENEVGFIAKLR